MLNQITLIGRVVAKPDLKYTPTGVPTADTRIAVDRPFKKEGGEKETDFIPLVFWREQAEFAANQLTKGGLVAVEGRLQIRSWKARDGSNRKTPEVIVNKIHVVESHAAPAKSAPVERVPSESAADTHKQADPFEDEALGWPKNSGRSAPAAHRSADSYAAYCGLTDGDEAPLRDE